MRRPSFHPTGYVGTFDGVEIYESRDGNSAESFEKVGGYIRFCALYRKCDYVVLSPEAVRRLKDEGGAEPLPAPQSQSVCPDCNGSRVYLGAGFLPPEPCRACQGPWQSGSTTLRELAGALDLPGADSSRLAHATTVLTATHPSLFGLLASGRLVIDARAEWLRRFADLLGRDPDEIAAELAAGLRRTP